MGKYGKKAVELHDQKYNCAQSVVLAFKDELGVDQDTLARLFANFGGGFGYAGEVCGAASGMACVSGFLGNWREIRDKATKEESYDTIKGLIEQFRKENEGNSRCDELRALGKAGGRSCSELIEQCADMVAERMGLDD